MINDRVYGQMTPEAINLIIDELEKEDARDHVCKTLVELEQRYNSALAGGSPNRGVCAGPGCAASGSRTVYERIKEELAKRDSHIMWTTFLENGTSCGVVLLEGGCQGFLPDGPTCESGACGHPLY